MEINSQFQKYIDNFKKAFEREKTHSIGVDVGGNNFKIVELEKKGGEVVLKNYALVKVDEKIIDGEGGLINNQTGELLAKIFDELGIKSRTINIALPSSSSLITLIDVNSEGESGDYINQAVELEAPKYIPVDLNEVIYDWEVIPEQDLESEKEEVDGKKEEQNEQNIQEEKRDKNNKKVLLVSVMKRIIKKFEKVFYDNEFEIDYLEVDCFPVKKALIRNSRKNYIILDIGGKLSSIAGVYRGNIIFNRNIDVAGDRLTELIANTMGVGKNKAEKIKIEKGFNNESSKLVENVIEPFFSSIVDQTKSSINEFSSFFKKEDISAVVLTGGTSQIKGLKNYLEKELGIKVYYGNPWAGVEYPKKIEGKLMSASPYFSVAMGLALMGFRSKK
ncbi:MAG: pilus assembly protein PilM [Candidatus Moraniibacteriota bacterium]